MCGCVCRRGRGELQYKTFHGCEFDIDRGLKSGIGYKGKSINSGISGKILGWHLIYGS
jgi:hypothetical protein